MSINTLDIGTCNMVSLYIYYKHLYNQSFNAAHEWSQDVSCKQEHQIMINQKYHAQ